MNLKRGHAVIAIILLLSFLAAVQGIAGSDDPAKQADTIIRDAERKMFSGNSIHLLGQTSFGLPLTGKKD